MKLVAEGSLKDIARRLDDRPEPESPSHLELGSPVRLTGYRTKTPPVREWVVTDLLPRGELAELAGARGALKSTMALVMAAHVAAGRPFLDHNCEPGEVVIITAEDDFDEVWRRLADAMKHWPEAEQDATFNRIRVWDVVGRGARVYETTEYGRAASTTLVEDVVEACDRADLVIFDPLARFHGLNENDNGAMDMVMGAFIQISKKLHCSVLVLHHSGKGPTAASRGASSIESATRAYFVQKRLSPDDCVNMGFAADDTIIKFRAERLSYAPDGWALDIQFANGQMSVIDADTLWNVQCQKVRREWDGQPFSKNSHKQGWVQACGFTQRDWAKFMEQAIKRGALTKASNQQWTF